MGNNQMLCADPASGEVRRFLTGPVACEITGLTFTPDWRTLFVGVQHPGRRGILTSRTAAPPSPLRRAADHPGRWWHHRRLMVRDNRLARDERAAFGRFCRMRGGREIEKRPGTGPGQRTRAVWEEVRAFRLVAGPVSAPIRCRGGITPASIRAIRAPVRGWDPAWRPGGPGETEISPRSGWRRGRPPHGGKGVAHPDAAAEVVGTAGPAAGEGDAEHAPSRQISTASMRNCCWMSRPGRRPPSVPPISRVRSVTETSMMFITPMPPTIREMRAMRAISVVRVALVWLMVWRMLSVLSRKKSWLPWRRVSRRLMPSWAASRLTSSRTRTLMLPDGSAPAGGSWQWYEGSRR